MLHCVALLSIECSLVHPKTSVTGNKSTQFLARTNVGEAPLYLVTFGVRKICGGRIRDGTGIKQGRIGSNSPVGPFNLRLRDVVKICDASSRRFPRVTHIPQAPEFQSQSEITLEALAHRPARSATPDQTKSLFGVLTFKNLSELGGNILGENWCVGIGFDLLNVLE